MSTLYYPEILLHNNHKKSSQRTGIHSMPGLFIPKHLKFHTTNKELYTCTAPRHIH